MLSPIYARELFSASYTVCTDAPYSYFSFSNDVSTRVADFDRKISWEDHEIILKTSLWDMLTKGRGDANRSN